MSLNSRHKGSVVEHRRISSVGFEHLIKAKLEANRSEVSKQVERDYEKAKPITDKPVNLVTNWTQLLIDVPEGTCFTRYGGLPIYIKAESVIYKELGSYNELHSDIRSSPILTQYDQFVFEDLTQIYVLIGPGAFERMTLDQFHTEYIKKGK